MTRISAGISPRVRPTGTASTGRRGYSLKYMRREELLTDVLRQYERYIRMIANSNHNLYLFDKKNDET